MSGSMDDALEGDEGDLTRKQRREQARAHRKELEEAAAAGAARRTRLTRLGIVVAVVVAAIVVILLATGGGSKGGIVKKGTGEEAKVVGEVTSLLSGIPQSGNVLGNPKAPVTLAYWGDLECPICKEFTLQALPSIVQQWVRTGKLAIEYRSFETATREPEVFKTQQIAALAAGKQNKMWQYVELFYHEQGEEGSAYATESYLQGLAQQVPGLSLTRWTSDRNEPALANQIATDTQTESQLGFSGTPAFQLGKTGGTLPTFEAGTFAEAGPYNSAIEKLLKS